MKSLGPAAGLLALALLAACSGGVVGGGVGGTGCQSDPDCEDGLTCTRDACDTASGECTHEPDDGLCADDGLFCDGREVCAPEASGHDLVTGCYSLGDPCLGGGECFDACNEVADDCYAAQGLPCTDDGNPCTDNVCNAVGLCEAVNNTASCDDGVFCNGADTCDGVGGCTTHAGDPCTGGSECADSCDEVAGNCLADAGLPCTDDGNVCTDNVCNAAGVCEAVNNTVSCDDGVFCNGADTCTSGACGHAGDPCAAGGECAGRCDEVAGNCFAGTGLPCTDDGNVCTDNICSALGVCEAVDNTISCDDGVFCNGADTCDGAGGCTTHAGDPCSAGAECANTCNETADGCNTPLNTPCTADTNVCTDDVCDGSGTCSHPNNTASCDDGVFCNGADTCGAGACTHAGDPCTGGGECADSCDEAAGDCFAAAGAACTDTAPSDCAVAQCDGLGVCDQSHDVQPGGSSCDDGSFCNGADTCDATGGCSVHAGDPCSPDTCNETTNVCVLRASWVSVVSGAYHACGLTVDSKPYCWGEDNAGQLGDGGAYQDAQSPSAVYLAAIAGSRTFVQLAAGGAHTCGLASDGKAYCWGDDFYGELGNGVAGDSAVPSAVDTSTIAGNKAFVQLSAGGLHTCGLTVDGVAYCWGDDAYGQLGNGGASQNSNSPSAVDTSTMTGNKAFVELVSGINHTCGLTADGRAYCWGSDQAGQLGNGGTSQDTQSPSPLDTSTITANQAFVQLSAGGGSHTCGLAADGKAYCWGSDFGGALGNGGTSQNSQSPSAVSTTPIAGNKAFVKVGAGWGHTCAVTADGVPYCWGYDAYGQLGDGGTAQSSQSPSAVDTSAFSGNRAFVQVSGGTYHTCGLAADGAVYCWGYDLEGQLGNGGGSTDTQSPAAVDVSSIAGLRAFVQSTAGGGQACGLTAEGVAYCWGDDFYGELGDGGTSSDADSPSAVDTSTISGNKAFVKLVAGARQTCGLTADGKAYCWGYDGDGQLGNGGVVGNSRSPSAVDTSTISGNKAFVQLTTGGGPLGGHACGRLADGVAYCWGSDSNGQLGNGATVGNKYSPFAVDTSTIVGNKAFVQLSAGGDHTCGLMADGAGYCWGRDSSGELGNGGTSADATSPSAVDSSTIAGNAAFVELATGVGHSCARTADGSAYCWGSDFAGQIGNGGTPVDTQSPSALDVSPISGNRGVLQLTAGWYHTCGLTAERVAYCWGNDSSGTLGNGGPFLDAQSPSAVDTSSIAGSRTFVQLTGGYADSCGITGAGAAYCWGSDGSGGLGNGSTLTANQPSPSPVDMSGL